MGWIVSTCGGAVFLVVGLLFAASVNDAEQQRVINAFMHANAVHFDKVESYSRTQHYSASDSRFGLSAELVARIYYRRLKGKTFEVLSRGGSTILQTHVFDPLLKEEIETSQLTTPERSLLSTHNYSFRLAGEETMVGRRCYVLELTPLRKDKHLLKGKAWVDAEDYAAVHVEGRFADSLSFWIGKPFMTSDFMKVSGLWFAAKRHSIQNSFLAGRSELTIEYRDYQIELR